MKVQLDFIVWSKMQKIMAAESFIKTFKDDDEENKEVINSEELHNQCLLCPDDTRNQGNIFVRM